VFLSLQLRTTRYSAFPDERRKRNKDEKYFHRDAKESKWKNVVAMFMKNFYDLLVYTRLNTISQIILFIKSGVFFVRFFLEIIHPRFLFLISREKISERL